MTTESHKPDCNRIDDREQCTCLPGEGEPELPPIIATVKVGDALIFLVPDMINWNPRIMKSHFDAMENLLPGVLFGFIPAVGVVHVPAPKSGD